MAVFCKMGAIFHIFIMADCNFPFLPHSEKQRPKLWGVSNLKFCCMMNFHEMRDIFFHFYIMMDVNFPFILTLVKADI